MRISEKIQARLRTLPDRPGVYLMRDAAGRIIYVGKAHSLRKRVQSYFREGSLRRGDAKLRSLVHSIADLDVLVLRSDAEATLTEGKLIKEYRPRFNVDFKDDKRFLLLRIHREEPAPRLDVCRLRKEDGAEYFGPYPSSRAARAAQSFAQRHFGLRLCKPRIPGPEDHKHCHWDLLRTCSAPCVGQVSAEDYRARAAEAAAFLRGERREILRALREDMERASADREYEKAAALRDTLFLLTAALKRRTRMARTPRLEDSISREGLTLLKDRLGLPRLPDVIECVDVSNISGTHAVASLVCAVSGRPVPSRYRRFRIRAVEGSDDPAMIAETVRRRYSRRGEPGWAPPDLLVVDGGLTQLRAARGALREIGLSDLPSAGLAKRFEDIIAGPEGSETVLRLPDDSSALMVLKRLRDEAHRFALAYHRVLRGRKIRESILDDLDGIGPKKKAALLRRFGSIARLREATVEQIASVPGVSGDLARAIHDHLAGS